MHTKYDDNNRNWDEAAIAIVTIEYIKLSL